MVLIFIFYPVYAEEVDQTTAWDAGYVKAEVILPTTTLSIDAIGSYGGSCVTFVKAQMGITESWHTPQYVWTHADLLRLKPIPYPTVGSIIITSEGPVWHMGIVETVGFDLEYGIMEIGIVESNFIVHNLINRRTLTIDSEVIVGFLQLD